MAWHDQRPGSHQNCAEHNRHFASLQFCFPIPDFGKKYWCDGEVGNRKKVQRVSCRFSILLFLLSFGNSKCFAELSQRYRDEWWQRGPQTSTFEASPFQLRG